MAISYIIIPILLHEDHIMSSKKSPEDEKISKDVGDRIRQVRKEADKTQRSFAKVLGVNFGHISKIERGLANPSIQLIKAISAIYELDELWLRTGEGPFEKLYREWGLTSWSEMTKEQRAEADPIRSDPVYEGLRLLLQDSSKNLSQLSQTLSRYRLGMKTTDKIRPEVLKAKVEMLRAINELLLVTDNLMEWVSPRKYSFTLAELMREEAKNAENEKKSE